MITFWYLVVAAGFAIGRAMVRSDTLDTPLVKVIGSTIYGLIWPIAVFWMLERGVEIWRDR